MGLPISIHLIKLRQPLVQHNENNTGYNHSKCKILK